MIKKPTREELIILAKSQAIKIDDEQLNLLEKEFDIVLKQFNKVIAIDTKNVQSFNFINAEKQNHLREDKIEKLDFDSGVLQKNTANFVNNLLHLKEK